MYKERFGYINTQGQWIVHPQLMFAEDFQEGLAYVILATDTGFTDINDQQTIYPSDPNLDFGEGMMDGYYINTSGQIAIAPSICTSGKYAGCEITGRGNFSEGLARAYVYGHDCYHGTGFIDGNGELVIEPQHFNVLGEFSEGIVEIQSEDTNEVGYMDRTGRIIVEPQFRSGRSFSGGVAKVNITVKVKSPKSKKYVSENKFTYINTQGKLIAPPQFDRCHDATEERCIVEIDNDFGCLDTSGRCIVEPQFEYMGQYSGGLSHTALDIGEWGFIDLEGNLAIPFKFEDATPFREGLAAVKYNGKWGFIDRAGEFVIAPAYEAMNLFNNCNYYIFKSDAEENQGFSTRLTENVGFFNGMARIAQDGEYFFINMNNEVITRQGFLDAYRFEDGKCIVKLFEDQDWKVGFMDTSGQIEYFRVPVEHAGIPVCYNWYEHIPFYKWTSSPFREGFLKVSSRLEKMSNE